MILRCLAACASFLALTLGLLPAVQPEPKAPRCAAAGSSEGDSFHRELFFAVLEGLYREGVDNETVDRVIEVEPQSSGWRHFVQGCPICMPALDAFRVYRGRPVLVSFKVRNDTFGFGLLAEERARLVGADDGERRAAIQALIERWVAERMQRVRLDAAERATWRQALEERRKQGMASLESLRQQPGSLYRDMKACALCDGATAACKTR